MRRLRVQDQFDSLTPWVEDLLLKNQFKNWVTTNSTLTENPFNHPIISGSEVEFLVLSQNSLVC